MCLFSIVVVGFALYFRAVAGVGLHDFNFEAFHNTLSAEQGAAIIRTARAHVTLVIWLMILTNLLWMVGAGWAMWRVERENG